MYKFKTESKRLLDLMANSIYTNTDIFLRELISNASDALDKKHYLSLTDETIKANDLNIHLTIDKDKRLLIIEDNGIGMNEADLSDNLGTIAKSGSYNFKKDLAENEKIDIIGQFGVGFYSAFMVADKIEVLTKKVKEDKPYLWTSLGAEGFTIEESQKETSGTKITLHLKTNVNEKDYDQYLNSYTIESLVKKYSDYIRYPIKMEVEITKPGKEEGQQEIVKELKTLNSMLPLWKKKPQEVKEEEYSEFYQNNFFDYQKPLKPLHYQVEGNVSYTALLFIPSKAPYNFYTTDYQAGLKLYSRGVFIKDECKELVSDYFRFVKGLIDAEDISLNISREILQEDYQMKAIKKSIDKKIANTLTKMLKDERKDYENFFTSFGSQLKYGAYQDYGANRDLLLDLILFKSSYNDEYVTLKEYISRLKDGQKDIYYACGENIEQIKALPQAERLLDKGYELLYFTDNVDEFMTTILNEYDKHPFKSIQKGNLDLGDEKEKDEIKEAQEEAKDFLSKIKEALKDKVSDVVISTHLKSQPVCLVSDEGVSLQMEKVLKEMKQGGEVKAKRILEINKDHPLYTSLKQHYEKNADIDSYASLLYNQALLIAGLPIENANEYANLVNEIMLKAINK